MLMLLFSVGQDRYALDVRRVVEVIPVPPLNRIPGAPDYFAGLFQYGGSMTPVIDLCCFFGGRPCQAHLSTRIIIVQRIGDSEESCPVGLMAESITDTVRKDATNSTAAGLIGAPVPYLSDIIRDNQGVIYCLELDRFMGETAGMLVLPAGRP